MTMISELSRDPAAGCSQGSTSGLAPGMADDWLPNWDLQVSSHFEFRAFSAAARAQAAASFRYFFGGMSYE